MPIKAFFFTALNSIWTWFWCLLVLLPFFVSPLPHQQNVSLGGLFAFGETNKQKKSLRFGETNQKSHSGEVRWIGRVGHGGHDIFGPKPLNTHCSVGRCAHKSLIMTWTNAMIFQKIFTKAECSLSQQRQMAHWYRWIPGTLTSRGSLYYKGLTLQKIIQGFLGGVPLISPQAKL